MNEIGLYIHIPFCVKKCNYCDFNSYPLSTDEDLKESYIKALNKELENYKNGDYLVKSVYIGGGTPTTLTNRQLESLLKIIHDNFRLKDGIEFSIEANPGTVDGVKLLALKNGGVNRISFGVQSTDDNMLKYLGRIHSYSDFLKSYEAARENGFKNINVDLIFGIPGQTLKTVEDSIRKIKKLSPEHVSAYNLIIEEGTKLKEDMEMGKIKAVDEGIELKMYHLIIDLLKVNYKHYEISNFAKPGMECIHNIIYWNNGQYIGAGAGACSRIGDIRHENARNISEYIGLIKGGNSAILYKEFIDKSTEIKETIFLGLRQIEGINISDWKKRFSEDFFDLFKDNFQKLNSLDLIEKVNDCVRLTKKGLFLSNEVFVEFM